MKFDAVSAKIDAFFESVTPNEVVKMFEEIGYEFDPKPSSYAYKITSEKSIEKSSEMIFHYRKHLVGNMICRIVINNIDSVHCNKKYMSARTEKVSSVEDYFYEGSDNFDDFSTAA